MGVATFALFLVVGLHIVQLWMVIVITLVSGIANAFDMPARQTLVADLVDEGMLRNAVTLGALEANLARIIGPSIGALCLAWFSMAGAFFIDFLTFVCGVIGMYKLRTNEFYVKDVAARAKGQLLEGLGYLRHNAVARTILLMMVLVGTLACEFFVTLPLLAKTTFHGDASMYASMTAASGIGAILGGLFIAGKTVPSRIDTLARYALLFAVASMALAFSQTYIAALLILVSVGATQLVLTTSANAMLMIHTTPAMRGRMNGWWVVIFMGSTPIGGPLMGWIAQHSTPGMAIAVGGVSTAIAGLWAFTQQRSRSQTVTPVTQKVS